MASLYHRGSASRAKSLVFLLPIAVRSFSRRYSACSIVEDAFLLIRSERCGWVVIVLLAEVSEISLLRVRGGKPTEQVIKAAVLHHHDHDVRNPSPWRVAAGNAGLWAWQMRATRR